MKVRRLSKIALITLITISFATVFASAMFTDALAELYYDDGSAEFTFGVGDTGWIGAVKFTYPYTAKIHILKFFCDGETAKVHVLDSGFNSIFSREVVPPSSTHAEWFTVDISSDDVFVNDDFYVGIEWMSLNLGLGVDSNSPHHDRSYLGLISSPGSAKSGENYMIRVICALARAPQLEVFITENVNYNVTVNGVTLPGDNRYFITKIHWDWGDGIQEDAWLPASHTYDHSGLYIINVTTYQSDNQITSRTLEIYVSEQVDIYEGWNLISLPCTPEDSSIEVVLGDIMFYVESVWAYDGETGYWSSYSPYAPSDLTEMVNGKGYWIKVWADVLWEIDTG